MRNGFVGVYGLLQYAPPDVHEKKKDVLKTIYDQIQDTIQVAKDERVILYQSYLQSCY